MATITKTEFSDPEESARQSSSSNEREIPLFDRTGRFRGNAYRTAETSESGGGGLEPGELLALAQSVYEDLTEEEVREIETAALDNSPWRIKPEDGLDAK